MSQATVCFRGACGPVRGQSRCDRDETVPPVHYLASSRGVKTKRWFDGMWVLDSGCTCPMASPHTIGEGMVPDSERSARVKVLTSNKEGSLLATKACDVQLRSNVAGCEEHLVLEGVLVSDLFSRNPCYQYLGCVSPRTA